jgi:hypothetical protein
MIIAERMTTIRVFGNKLDSSTADSHALATLDAKTPCVGSVQFVTADCTGELIVWRIESVRVDRCRACLQPNSGRIFAFSRAERIARAKFILESKISG